MALPFDLYYVDPEPEGPAVRIELRTGDEPLTIHTEAGRIRAHRGGSERPDAVLTGSPKLVVGLLSGHLGLAEAGRLGLRVDGDPAVLTRVRATSATAEG